jgi:hypothetical protein
MTKTFFALTLLLGVAFTTLTPITHAESSNITNKPCRSQKGLLGINAGVDLLRLAGPKLDLDLLNGCSLLDLDFK